MNETLAEEAPVASNEPAAVGAVLLIDDEAAMTAGLAKLLGRRGFVAHCCAQGTEALRFLQANRVDVVLTDIYMAEMDGFEVITRIRAQHPGLPIIAMSGGGRGLGLGCLSIAHKLGAVVTLQKPLDLDQLIATLDRFAGRARSR